MYTVHVLKYMYLDIYDKVERFGCQLRKHKLARLQISKYTNYYVSGFLNQYWKPILSHITLNINRTPTLIWLFLAQLNMEYMICH